MRVKTGTVRRKRHKKILKMAKGFYSGRRKHFRKAKEQVKEPAKEPVKLNDQAHLECLSHQNQCIKTKELNQCRSILGNVNK